MKVALLALTTFALCLVAEVMGNGWGDDVLEKIKVRSHVPVGTRVKSPVGKGVKHSLGCPLGLNHPSILTVLAPNKEELPRVTEGGALAWASTIIIGGLPHGSSSLTVGASSLLLLGPPRLPLRVLPLPHVAKEPRVPVLPTKEAFSI